MVLILEGSADEIARKVIEALQAQAASGNPHARATLIVQEPLLGPTNVDDMERDFLEFQGANAVSFGHADCSREAMYTRMEGE